MVKIKTCKNRLSNIFKKGIDYEIFHNAIKKANDIRTIGYHFYRAYILHLFEKNEPIPIINRNFFRTALSVVTKSTNRGAKVSNENCRKIKESMNAYFKEHFYKVFNSEETKDTENHKLNGHLLGFCLDELASEMMICHENNIKRNFLKYFNSYANSLLTGAIGEAIIAEKITNRSVKGYLKNIKDDIINNTLKSPQIFHAEIEVIRKYVFPELKIITLEELSKDIDNRPYYYLESMLRMNYGLEKIGRKCFQPLCLDTSMNYKYITFGSSSIANLFCVKNKYHILKSINSYKGHVWDTFFNIKWKGYRDYRFNHRISTDGFSVSIQLIHEGDYMKHQESLKKRAKMGLEIKNKGPMTAAEEESQKDKILQQKRQQQLKNKRLKTQYKEKFSKLSKEEQERKKLEIKLKRQEYNYVEDLIKNQIFWKKLKNTYDSGKVVVIDPGKKSILTLRSSNNITFNYRNRRRIKQNKRLKKAKLIKNKREKHKLSNGKTIVENENGLNNFNSKTTIHKSFLGYVTEKLKLYNLVIDDEIYHEYLLKHRWHSYLNNKRHEDKLKDELRQRFGNDCMYIMGDWNESSLPIKYMSTPGASMRKLISQTGEMYLIDEFRTSIYHNKTYEKMSNLTLDVKGSERRLHSVLTFKMGTKGGGCINRDRNATLNMLAIVKGLIDIKGRPAIFDRSKAKKEKLKTPNLNRSSGSYASGSKIDKKLQECVYRIRVQTIDDS